MAGGDSGRAMPPAEGTSTARRPARYRFSVLVVSSSICDHAASEMGASLDGGYSFFSPLRDPILSLMVARRGGRSRPMSAWFDVGGVAASPLMLSRNVAEGTKNKLPVTAWLKSSRRS